MKKEIICTVCPRGCHIQVEGEGDNVISVEGNACKRGFTYASAEFSHPVRILTTTVKIKGASHDLLPVRSQSPLPKEKLFECMDIIRGAEATLPVKCGDVIIPDIASTGINIVATKNID
ncbi:MAG: DUF1667 domain-containing protein [Clostridia bacterium]|nr:DUF1667 domain-containing protein [Clostridia bacterium]